MYFLITWTTHGYWLPGDPRGFRTHRATRLIEPPARYALGDERPYDSSNYERLRNYIASRSSQAIRLNTQQMQIAARILIEVGSPLAADCVVSVGPFHVHVLVDLLTKVTTGFFCNRVKSRSSLRLSDYGLKGKVWARRYHAKWLAPGDVENARRYILAHAAQGAVVMESGPGSTTP